MYDIDNDDCGVADDILIKASQEYEEHRVSSGSRFGVPVTSEKLEEVRASGTLVSAQYTITWVLKVWQAWAHARNSGQFVEERKSYALEENFEKMAVESITFWLPKFVIEVRRADGNHYPPNSIYSLCCALQRSLKAKDAVDFNIFSDVRFNRFRQVLDSEMKRLKATGKFEWKSADVIINKMDDRL